MVFKEVLEFLFQRALKDGRARTEDDYAKLVDIPRTVLSQLLSGSLRATPEYINRVLVAEEYRIDEVIDLPELQADRAPYLADAEKLLKRGDKYGEFLRWQIEDLGRRASLLSQVAIKEKSNQAKHGKKKDRTGTEG